MASLETQESCTKSPQSENTIVTSESKRENKKLPSTCEKQDGSTNDINMVENENTTAVDSIKNTAKASNCDNVAKETENDVIVLENDSAQNNCNTDKAEDVQNVRKPNAASPVLENDSTINNGENLKEISLKGGNNLKRKRRTVTAQETDSLLEESSLRSKRKKTKNITDRFCWRCHKESADAHCSACPRSWHRRCIGGMQPSTMQNWICGECATILRAENAETRSTAMAQLSVDQLCLLLKHVVERMREYPGSEPFWKPVELSEAPNYLEYVVKPMDLSLLESNVRAKLYGSTDAFMADAKWIQHNCIVFNTCGGVYTDTSKLTNAAKQIIKLARQEVSEIEACPDCYAHGRNLPRPQPSWFIEPCRRPHTLVWAKLKGFPFWPAKAMPRINSQGFVDVRFFGEHDRAWVSPRDLYLYSEDPPAPLPRKRKLDMDECVREITRHCRKLELVFGQFKFAPPKVQYNPHDPMQITLMLPNYDPLHPGNCASSQFLTPKKRPLPKKRMHIKGKSQGDAEKADSSDIENKTVNDCNKNVTCDTKIVKPKVENETQSVQKSKKPDEIELISSSSNDSSPTIESAKPLKMEVQEVIHSPSTVTEATMKNEDLKPCSSKTIDTNDIATQHNESVLSGIKMDQNSSQKNIDETKLLEHSSKQVSCPVQNSNENIQVPKKESVLKSIPIKADISHNLANTQKVGFKSTKSVAKVYKPKTRMVDKVNAERALKSISANDQNQKSSTEEAVIKVPLLQAESVLVNDALKNPNNSLTSPSLSIPHITLQSNIGDSQVSIKHAADQPVALLLVNNNISDTEKQLISITDKQKSSDTSAIQQVPKDIPPTLHQKKESKARKSFPNKARNYSQVSSYSSPNTLPNSMDSMVYIPTHQSDNCLGYQLLPPEAGPISARLYHDAQDLARRMAQLMEEAYKEAAQETHSCENGVSENHQATVHFLRLQIERMRWQHQQQLAELKHNTDRILREMRASLEAERLRAIEETRREAEEEKIRCIEEIKRKQWCAMCGREALFYCCWNTAYCDYPCQQSHWPTHMRTCAQQPSFTTIVTSSAASSNQQQVMPRLMINTQHVTSNVWRA